jgi:hypothetical protein
LVKGSSISFLFGIAVGALAVALFHRLGDIVSEDDAADLELKISDQLRELEQRTAEVEGPSSPAN